MMVVLPPDNVTTVPGAAILAMAGAEELQLADCVMS
jgi:hypothetical protein